MLELNLARCCMNPWRPKLDVTNVACISSVKNFYLQIQGSNLFYTVLVFFLNKCYMYFKKLMVGYYGYCEVSSIDICFLEE